MDQSYLLLLGVAIVVALVAGAMIRARLQVEDALASPVESPFAVSTEGQKVCPRCGMGNGWTEGRCVTCGTPLKG